MLRAILNILFVGLLLAYPVLVYFGLQHYSLSSIAPVLLIAIIGRYVLIKGASAQMPWLLPGTVLGALCIILSWLLNISQLTLAYPVVISSVMFFTFSYSLFRGPTVIESFALLDEKRKAHDKHAVSLPAHVIAYTRTVTKVWCAFFVINGVIASYTIALDDIQLWTVYNGLVAYLLMGVLIIAELAVRHFVKKAHESKGNT